MEENSILPAIEERTAKMEAETVIANLSGIWKALGHSDDSFDEFFDGMLKIEERGEHGDVRATVGGVFYFDADTPNAFSEYAMACVGELEFACIYAIKSMKAEPHSHTAWVYACQAHQSLGLLMGLISGWAIERKNIEVADRLARSAEAVRRANQRWADDPLKEKRDRAKIILQECWLAWKENPKSYTGELAFAIDVADKIETKPNEEPVISISYIHKKLVPKLKSWSGEPCVAWWE